MRIFYSPQESRKRITYDIQGEVITATIGDESDTFDFSTFPEGRAVDFETSLSVIPIISAERDAQGGLWVKVLKFIGNNAAQEERFPDWVEVS